MSQPTDDELLRSFTETRCDQAFGKLVSRHLDLVHSVATLPAAKAAAFDQFVEERHSIEIEGWAFNRSQELAKELHLKPKQRQAVFDELIASKSEDSERVGALFDDQQRSSYEKLPPKLGASLGVGISFFNSGPAPKP